MSECYIRSQRGISPPFYTVWKKGRESAEDFVLKMNRQCPLIRWEVVDTVPAGVKVRTPGGGAS